MKNKYLSFMVIIGIVFFLLYTGIGCKKEIPLVTVEEPVEIEKEEEVTMVEEEKETADEAPKELSRKERPCHVLLADRQTQATYLYREFIQTPCGMAYGPDGCIHIADLSGRHIVKINPDGEMEDLGLWKNQAIFNSDGPRDVDFDSSGNLYFCTHSGIYSVRDDGSIEIVPNVSRKGEIGGIAFSPSDELFYTDRGQGKVFKIDSNGDSVVVVDDLKGAEFLTFGLDGTLYVSRSGIDSRVVSVDVSTCQVSEFFTPRLTGEVYLAVDSDGDIWIRGLLNLFQVSTGGDIKQFFIDGKDSSEFNFGTSGGIAINDRGDIYIGSAPSSKVWKLTPISPEKKDDKYTLEMINKGFFANDMDAGPDGKVYIQNHFSGELICFKQNEESEILLNFWEEDIAAIEYGLAVDSKGNIFIGTAAGEIKVLEPDGNISHYASVAVSQIKCGTDDKIYALTKEENPKIICISDVDTYKTFISKIEGFPFDPYYTVQLAPAPDGGLYIYSVTSRKLYYSNPKGEVELFFDLNQSYSIMREDGSTIIGGDPYLITASPSGDIFIGCHSIYKIDQNKEIFLFAPGLSDAPPIDTSPDGEWLYAVEAGSIVMIPIETESVELLRQKDQSHIPKEDEEGGFIVLGGEYEGVWNAIQENYRLGGPDPSIKSYISWDITGISNSKVKNAEISFYVSEIYKNPIQEGKIIVKSVNWGERTIVMDDSNLDGKMIASSDNPIFIITGDSLISELQKAVDEKRSRFQIMVYFEFPEDDGGYLGHLIYKLLDIALCVDYVKK